MSETLIHRGPDAEGTFVKGGVGLASRRLAIIDLAGGDQPISNEDGSCTVVQNGEIYNYARAEPLARARRPHAAHALGHRDDRPRLRGVGSRVRRAAARDVRDRDLGRAPQAARARPRPVRDQAALLPRRRRRALVRLRARRAAEGRPRPRRARGVPRDQHRSRPALDLPRDPQAAARARADLGGRQGRPRALRAARAAAGARRRRGRAARGVPGAPARLGARASRLRRPGRRAALGRRRLGDVSRRSPPRRAPSRCARSRSGSRSSRSTSSPARGRSRSATGRGIASSCCDRTRRCSCPRWPTRSTSRSRTPRRCRPTSSRGSRPRT